MTITMVITTPIIIPIAMPITMVVTQLHRRQTAVSIAEGGYRFIAAVSLKVAQVPPNRSNRAPPDSARHPDVPLEQSSVSR